MLEILFKIIALVVLTPLAILAALFYSFMVTSIGGMVIGEDGPAWLRFVVGFLAFGFVGTVLGLGR